MLCSNNEKYKGKDTKVMPVARPFLDLFIIVQYLLGECNRFTSYSFQEKNTYWFCFLTSNDTRKIQNSPMCKWKWWRMFMTMKITNKKQTSVTNIYECISADDNAWAEINGRRKYSSGTSSSMMFVNPIFVQRDLMDDIDFDYNLLSK